MPKTFTDSPHRPQRVYSRVPLPSQFILLARPASQSFLIVREAQLDTVRVNSIPVLLVRDRLTTARDQRPSTLIPTPAHQHNPFFPTTLSLSLSLNRYLHSTETMSTTTYTSAAPQTTPPTSRSSASASTSAPHASKSLDPSPVAAIHARDVARPP
jgi:hypothetical protein